MNAESSTVQGSVHFATKTNYLKIFCFVWSNLSQILKYFILDLSTSHRVKRQRVKRHRVKSAAKGKTT